MAWTAPMTAVAGAVFTAAQFNQHIRDNLNMTAPALATTPGAFFAVSDANQIAERIAQIQAISTSQTTTSTTYTDLATFGPEVTVETGPCALILLSGSMENSGAGSSRMAYETSGATSTAASDVRGLAVTGGAGINVVHGTAIFEDTLQPGLNTFTAKYRVGSGTGTFSGRRINVIPF